MKKILFVLVLVLMVISCTKLLPKGPANDALLDGPVEGLTNEQRAIFLRGDVAFNDDIFTKETGLGPLFVANSCAGCHAADGKGHPFSTFTRFAKSDTLDNPSPPQGGPQPPPRRIPRFSPEPTPTGATFSNFTTPANT